MNIPTAVLWIQQLACLEDNGAQAQRQGGNERNDHVYKNSEFLTVWG